MLAKWERELEALLYTVRPPPPFHIRAGRPNKNKKQRSLPHKSGGCCMYFSFGRDSVASGRVTGRRYWFPPIRVAQDLK